MEITSCSCRYRSTYIDVNIQILERESERNVTAKIKNKIKQELLKK